MLPAQAVFGCDPRLLQGVSQANPQLAGLMNVAQLLSLQKSLKGGAFVQPGIPQTWHPGVAQHAAALGAASKPSPGQDPAPMSDKESRELKRKRANRESARRSKQRKKEEFENLTRQVADLQEKGQALRTEIAKAEGVMETLLAQNELLRQQVQAVHGNLDCLGPAGRKAAPKHILADLREAGKRAAGGKAGSESDTVSTEGANASEQTGEGERRRGAPGDNGGTSRQTEAAAPAVGKAVGRGPGGVSDDSSGAEDGEYLPSKPKPLKEAAGMKRSASAQLLAESGKTGMAMACA